MTWKKQTENRDTLRERHVQKLFYQSGNYMYTLINPALGTSLSPQLIHQITHTFCTQSPSFGPLQRQQQTTKTTKGGHVQMSTNMANWYMADRLKGGGRLTFPLLCWCKVISNKCPDTHSNTQSSPWCVFVLLHAGIPSGVCWRLLPYFLGLFFFFFLISPRAFKICPGQMGNRSLTHFDGFHAH